MKNNLRKEWNEFKKDLTWDNFKILICGLVPLVLYFYSWSYWFNYLSELLNHKYDHPKTLEEAAIVLCILCGMLLPVFFAINIANLGFWLGKTTKFFRDDKTRRLRFDDVEYFIRDMPQAEREKIKEILSAYKSKYQLRKESKSNQSWFRRNFT